MITKDDITVVIPSVPPRQQMLYRALRSAQSQTVGDVRVLVTVDKEGAGAVWTRNHLLSRVETDWVAFLDDDDEFLPYHLDTLMKGQIESDADVVFADWLVPEAPFFRLDSYCYGQFDPENPKQTTITTLTRKTLLDEVGGFTVPPGYTGVESAGVAEDFWLTKRMIKAGGKFHHAAPGLHTWLWHHHGMNLSGMDWHRKYIAPPEV